MIGMQWETLASDTLREVRRRRGLSQRGLARVTGIPQSTISEIESGQRQPTLPLLGRIVEGTGRPVELRLVAEHRFSATSVARRMARALQGELPPEINDTRAAREDAALRSVLDLRDALLRLPPEEAMTLIADRPVLSGDRRFEALLAAVVEDVCARLGVSPPFWTQESERSVRPFWYLSDTKGLHWWELSTSPGAFL